MKLLTTIAAVLISLSAFSQDYIKYENQSFLSNEKFIKRADKQFQKVADKLNEAINQQGNKKLQKVMGQ